MSLDNLGKVYADGECVVREGEEGSTMFVVLSGHLQVLGNQDGILFIIILFNSFSKFFKHLLCHFF